MFNYNKISNNMKAFCINFSNKISKSLSMPITKSICDLLFGLLKSQSSLLSNIARALQENIKIKDTVDRLSKNLDKISNNKDIIIQNYYNIIKDEINENTCFHIDNSDINKDSSSKLEDLDRIKDGSSKDKKIVNGYLVTEIVATNKSDHSPISMYSKIFSTISKEYISTNDETVKAIEQIFKFFGNIGTYVLDRGYDDKKYMEYFIKKELTFIIRGKINRKVIYNGEEINIVELSKKFKGRYNITLKMKGKMINSTCSYAKIGVKGIKEPIYVVFVYFKNKVSIFYTNKEITCKKDVTKVAQNYYMRWRIEEYFKYKKQRFDLENYRVRSLSKMNALNLMISLTISLIYLLIKNSNTTKERIIEVSKVIKKEVYFQYYRITDGIKIILSHNTKGVRHLIREEKPPKYLQLTLFEVA